jgi:hypothetical protein
MSGGTDDPMRKAAEFAELADGRGKRVEVGGEEILLVVGALGCQRERATAILSERMRAPLPVDEALRLVRSA